MPRFWKSSSERKALKQVQASSFNEPEEYTEPRPLFRQMDQAERETKSEGHGDSLSAKSMLAKSLYEQKKYTEAESLFRQLEQVSRETSGEDHSDTVNTKYGLARSLYMQEKYTEAESLFRQVEHAVREAKGEDHRDTLSNKYWLARSLYEQEKYTEAESLFRQLEHAERETNGEDHGNTVEIKYWLARSLYMQEKYTEAESLLRQVTQGFENSLGANHEYTQSAKALLAKCRLQLQTHHEADKDSSSEAERNDGIAQIAGERSDSHHTLLGTRSTRLPTTSNGAEVRSSNERLDYFFENNTESNSSFTDAQILEISSLLKHLQPNWGRCPRLYIVLRIMDCLHLLDEIIADGFCDYWFPVRESNVPRNLSTIQRQDFLTNQHLIVTESLDLEKGAESRHCYFHKSTSIPLRKLRILGRGGFGQVDEVLSLVSHKVYARKRVLRSTLMSAHRPEHLKTFVTEIETLKRLEHKHVVKFVGSYSDIKYLGLLIHPVAEMDLLVYLARPTMSTCLGELRTFFGCLATALAFLHDEQIRHKDIKPQNILVNRGNVLLTDFGLALDFTDAEGSTTMSTVKWLTPQYCAPEVAECEPRDKSSDVWSLGVVFLEMLVILKGQTVKFTRAFFEKHGCRRPYIRNNRAAFVELSAMLADLGDKNDNVVIKWVEDMVQMKSQARPSARSVANSICDPEGNGRGNTKFCGMCCSPRQHDANLVNGGHDNEDDSDDDEFSDFSD